MAKVTIVKPDNWVIVDDYGIDSLDLTGLEATVHAIQWDGSTGHIERTDGTNETLTSVSAYQSIIDAHAVKKAAELAEVAANAPSDLDLLREQRNRKLYSSDWTQMADSPLTDTQKASWQTYRQSLRDITNTYSDLDNVVWPSEPS